MKPGITFRNKYVSFVLEKRQLFINLILFLMIALACIVGPVLGNTLLSPFEVVSTIMGNGMGANDFIVMQSSSFPYWPGQSLVYQV
ncbi:hypothetical protein [Thalassobacillus sp. C254]|uniref:hypothetical protein n=1 Tax=Thalassobacillus sp. C254 TaxID=1225341 RepID=UPI0022B6F728|nr:hypothetical protein [Thalassobacillus sp. C254]